MLIAKNIRENEREKCFYFGSGYIEPDSKYFFGVVGEWNHQSNKAAITSMASRLTCGKLLIGPARSPSLPRLHRQIGQEVGRAYLCVCVCVSTSMYACEWKHIFSAYSCCQCTRISRVNQPRVPRPQHSPGRRKACRLHAYVQENICDDPCPADLP